MKHLQTDEGNMDEITYETFMKELLEDIRNDSPLEWIPDPLPTQEEVNEDRRHEEWPIKILKDETYI